MFEIAGRLRLFCNETKRFAGRCLNPKKIVVISDNKIVSIPITTRLQSVIVLFVVVGMLWVSHSTGKYFKYETIISEKNSEIWSTSAKNEDLQNQVQDLYHNLKEATRYLATLRDLERVAESQPEDKNDSMSYKQISSVQAPNENRVSQSKQKAENLSKAEHQTREQEKKVKQILEDIQDKVEARISNLESAINMTGVDVATIVKHNEQLGAMIQQRGEFDGSDTFPQGGPFIPVDQEESGKGRFETNIDYLVELERVVHAFPLKAPLDTYYLSSRFGKRVDPIRKRAAMHKGLDLVGRYGSKVHSSAPGRVTFAGRKGAYGLYVEIDHGSGMSTRYGHLKQINVEKGKVVARGEIIGLQGNSGRSTGSHLHYEVRVDGKPVDPYNFLKAGRYVF